MAADFSANQVKGARAENIKWAAAKSRFDQLGFEEIFTRALDVDRATTTVRAILEKLVDKKEILTFNLGVQLIGGDDRAVVVTLWLNKQGSTRHDGARVVLAHLLAAAVGAGGHETVSDFEAAEKAAAEKAPESSPSDNNSRDVDPNEFLDRDAMEDASASAADTKEDAKRKNKVRAMRKALGWMDVKRGEADRVHGLVFPLSTTISNMVGFAVERMDRPPFTELIIKRFYPTVVTDENPTSSQGACDDILFELARMLAVFGFLFVGDVGLGSNDPTVDRRSVGFQMGPPPPHDPILASGRGTRHTPKTFRRQTIEIIRKFEN